MMEKTRGFYGIRLQEMGFLILGAAEILSRILADESADAEALARRVRVKSALAKIYKRVLSERTKPEHIQPIHRAAHIRITAKALHRMMASLEKTVSDVIQLQIEGAMPFRREISETIICQTREICAALSGMSNGRGPVDHCHEVIRLAAEVRRLLDSSIQHIRETAKDPLQVIKWSQVVDDLRDSSMAARFVAYVLISDLNELSCAVEHIRPDSRGFQVL